MAVGKCLVQFAVMPHMSEWLQGVCLAPCASASSPEKRDLGPSAVVFNIATGVQPLLALGGSGDKCPY